MEKIELISKKPEETCDLGRKIAANLKGNEIIFLQGQLGTGKTFLVSCIVAGLGYRGEVNSPTFVLQQEYPARFPVLHLDLYRLNSGEELKELGLEEYIGEKIWLVEWADLYAGFLPSPDLIIELEMIGEQERKINLWTRSLADYDFGN